VAVRLSPLAMQPWVSRVSTARSSDGACALHALASKRRGSAAVRAALTVDASAACELDADGWLPLHVAAYAPAASSSLPAVAVDAVQVLDLLLAAHAEGAATPERTHAWLPLHLAVISRSPPAVILRLLAAFPAGAAARDAQGYTPAQHGAIHSAPPQCCLRCTPVTARHTAP
jgi:hypothetical protein